MNKNIRVIGVLSVLAIASGVSYSLLSSRRAPNGSAIVVSSIMLPRTVRELADNSYAAVAGTVVGVKVAREKSFVRPDALDIVTTATIKVDRYLTNPNKLGLSLIEVKTIGGAIGEDSMVAEGWPEFVQGTKVVVFLNRIEENSYTVFGTAQGKFTINDDGTLGTEREKPFISSVFKTEAVTLTELESEISAVTK